MVVSEGTTYHFRLVASNADASAQGEGQTFTTRSQAPVVLPDERAWELVSPALKIGEVFAPEPTGVLGGSCTECLPGSNDPMMPMQTRPDGDAVVFEGQTFTGGFAVGANEYVGSRGGSGWGTSDLSGTEFASGRADGQSGFKAFSSDLTHGILSQSSPTLSPQAPVNPEGRAFSNLYLWVEGELEPLVTSEPPNRSPGVGAGGTTFLPVFAGANSGAAAAPPSAT